MHSLRLATLLLCAPWMMACGGGSNPGGEASVGGGAGGTGAAGGGGVGAVAAGGAGGLAVGGSGGTPPSPVPVLGNGAHSLDAVTTAVIVTSADGLSTPRDLEFSNFENGQLWIVNN